MGRSSWKFKFFSKNLWRKIFKFIKYRNLKYKKTLLYDRRSSIPACFTGFSFNIHKGFNFRKLMVNKYNVGYKFGEFSFSRKPFHFPLKKKQ